MKLSQQERITRKELRSAFVNDGGSLYYDPEKGITIALRRRFEHACKTVYMAVAVASDTETRYSRKRGELVALQHYADGEVLTIPCTNPINLAGYMFVALHNAREYALYRPVTTRGNEPT